MFKLCRKCRPFKPNYNWASYFANFHEIYTIYARRQICPSVLWYYWLAVYPVKIGPEMTYCVGLDVTPYSLAYSWLLLLAVVGIRWQRNADCRKILLCAPSNAGIDELCRRLKQRNCLFHILRLSLYAHNPCFLHVHRYQHTNTQNAVFLQIAVGFSVVVNSLLLSFSEVNSEYIWLPIDTIAIILCLAQCLKPAALC